MTDLNEITTAASELCRAVDEFFVELDRTLYLLRIFRCLSLVEEERRLEMLRRSVEGKFSWADNKWREMLKQMEPRLGKPETATTEAA